jgi:predicted AAA+ superfamily ATPase
LISKIISNETHYIFLDEIQYVEDFERALNSIRVSHNVSIVATGSNAKLLSGELRSLLSGRFISFDVPSFSFREVCEILDVSADDYDEALSNYLVWGGLPGRFQMSGDNETRNYLTDVFDSIAARDVIERGKIHNTPLMMSLLRYLLETTGNLFSVQKTANYLTSIGRKASRETIYNYLELLASALIMQKCERFNIAGKEIMSNSAKYYTTDVGIMQIKASPSKVNVGSNLENIVYNELKRRGYQVYVGHLNSAEIDFVAIKNDELKYIQVTSYLDGNSELQKREYGALESVHDNYEKYLISLDKLDMSRNGIKHLNIIDWLLSAT